MNVLSEFVIHFCNLLQSLQIGNIFLRNQFGSFSKTQSLKKHSPSLKWYIFRYSFNLDTSLKLTWYKERVTQGLIYLCNLLQSLQAGNIFWENQFCYFSNHLKQTFCLLAITVYKVILKRLKNTLIFLIGIGLF